MRRSLAVILSTATLGTMIAATGCAEHRYPNSGPYYGPYYGYNGWDAAEQARYREWLAERRYGYVDYNRLPSQRQREYWAWRNAHYGRSVQDEYRDYNRNRVERNGRDRDDRNRQYVRDRDDRNRQYRDRDDRNRNYRNHSRDREHDRKRNDRNHDRDHDHDHDHR